MYRVRVGTVVTLLALTDRVADMVYGGRGTHRRNSTGDIREGARQLHTTYYCGEA
jgi:hypothetical protein